MRNILGRQLSREFILYVGGGALAAGVPFILLPILTRSLSPASYGTYAMFMVVVSFVASLTHLGQGIGRKFVDRERISFAIYVSTSLVLSLSLAAALGIISLPLIGPLSAFTAIPIAWLWMVIVIAMGQNFISVVLTLLQMERRPILYNVYRIGQALAFGTLAVSAVVWYDADWHGVVLAQLVVVLAIGSLGAAGMARRGNVSLGFDWEHSKHAFRYSLPLVPHALAASTLGMTDRLFLTNYADISVVGIYSAGFQIGMVMYLITSSFYRAWIPWLYERLEDGSEAAKRSIVKVSYLVYAAYLVTAALSFTLLDASMGFLVGPDYRQAADVVPWIILGFTAYGMYAMLCGYFYYLEITTYLAVSAVLAAVVNIGLNYLLVPTYGAIGAAQATAASYALLFLITWLIISRRISMPWLLRRQMTA